MNWNASTIENLRRVFTDGFVARDIAEPLVSFDASTACKSPIRDKSSLAMRTSAV
jgi:hypothetical protein